MKELFSLGRHVAEGESKDACLEKWDHSEELRRGVRIEERARAADRGGRASSISWRSIGTI